MKTTTYDIANFSIYSSWVVKNKVITSGPSTGTTDKTITVTLPAGATFESAVLTVTCGGTIGGARTLTAGGHNLSTSTTNTVDISDVVDGAGEKTITFAFRDNGKANLSDGTHGSTMHFSNVSVTVTYDDDGEEPEPEPVGSGTAQASYNIANFGIYSSWTVKNNAITSGPSTGRADKTINVTLPQDATFEGATLQVTCGGTIGGANILSAGGHTLTPSATNIIDISDVVTGAGEKTITFLFKDNGRANLKDGTHGSTMSLKDVVVTVTYSYEGDEPEEPDEPDIDHTPNHKIALFGPREYDYSGNGLLTLNPISCIVTEIAGGSYECELVHLMDEHGKWRYLIEDYQIRSPVPEQVTPRVEVPGSELWQVKAGITSTPLYSQLPYYTKAKTQADTVRDNPSQYAWSSGTHYSAGAWVTYNNGIYRARYASTGAPPGYNDYWEYVDSLSGDGGGGSSSNPQQYNPGKIAEQIPGGEMVIYIADYNSSYFRARSIRGVTGYIRRSDCEQQSSSGDALVFEPRVITEQVFRIYSVVVDTDKATVTVNARHKSYDYAGNSLMDCQVAETDPVTAIAIMQGCLVNEDTRNIVCNLTEPKLDKDWSWNNPVYALLEPDEGIVPLTKAMLVRDNDDFFILQNKARTGITLSYGVNLLGVTWTRSTEDVITRVLPRGKKSDDTDLFLDELYIDSEHINLFPVVKVEILDCDCEVGQKIEKPDGTKQTLTEADCITKLREKAQERFEKDKVDAVLVELEVEFLLLGDTEEYKQYRGLQSVRLYDKIRIKHGPLGLDTTVQVSEYEYDAIMRRFNRIKLGDVFSYGGRTVTGYNMTNGAITYQKLSPGLVKRIRTEGE